MHGVSPCPSQSAAHTSVLGMSGRRIWVWEELRLVLLVKTLEGHQWGSCWCEGLQERPQSSVSCA